jgi:nucleoside-diphosphate-sugar epimerase
MRILFTGGSGKASRHAITYLRDQGHRVTNLDWMVSEVPSINTLKVDLTDAGQVFNACQAYAEFDELEPGTGMPRYDAIVYFAAILHWPDNETCR